MTPYHFSLTISDDGTAHAFVVHRGVFVASRTFKSGDLGPLPDWLNDASIWTRDLHQFTAMEPTITYDHLDGKLHLRTSMTTSQAFDPNDDEHLARLVRVLKRKSPKPEDFHAGHQPQLPDLPLPTEADLARRTIYSQVGTAEGAGERYSKPKARYNQPSASALKTKELVKSIMSDLWDL